MPAPADKVPKQAIGTVRVPKDRLLRPWRPIPGLEDAYGVTQTGQVRSEEHGELWDPDDWPRIWLTSGDDRLVEVNVMAAVALALLPPEQRSRIRAELPPGSRGGDPAVIELERELQVSRHAIAHLTHVPEDMLRAVVIVGSGDPGDRHRVERAAVEDYSAFLHEHYRPPSRGGNTSALHVHRMTIDGHAYTFFARGGRRWVFKGDRVSFDYRVTPEGYRNAIRTTIVTQDAAGRPVVRGDSRAKETLRSVPTKPPGSRRERRS